LYLRRYTCTEDMIDYRDTLVRKYLRSEVRKYFRNYFRKYTYFRKYRTSCFRK